MHYYKRNLGDYAKKAGRLSMLQHGSYTLLIDACYDREQFPTMDEAIDWTWASSTAEIEAVEFVLRKFFVLEDGRFVQKRIQEEIADYHAKSETNARIAAEREANRKANSTKRARSVDDALQKNHEPPPNQEPITINQEPISIGDSAIASQTPKPAKRATPIPGDFYPNETGVAYADERRVSMAVELRSFCNHHQAKGTTMKDWQAAWRTWCDKAVEFGRAGKAAAPQALSFAERDEQARRRRWEEMTGRKWPTDGVVDHGEIFDVVDATATRGIGHEPANQSH